MEAAGPSEEAAAPSRAGNLYMARPNKRLFALDGYMTNEDNLYMARATEEAAAPLCFDAHI